MFHQTDSLHTPDGLDLFLQRWLPEGEAVAHILLVHGYAEHSGRYAHVGEFFAGNGYGVHGFDLRGHGRSGGKQAYIDRFELYLKDLTAVLDQVRKAAAKKPVFLYGHSMGGAVVAWYVITRQPKNIAGVLLTGTAVKLSGDISPALQRLSGVIGEWLPKLKTLKLDTGTLSRDPRVVAGYENDPLVYHGPTYARTGAELIRAGQQIQANLAKFELPVLVMHGAADGLIDPEGSRLFAEGIGSTDKTLRLYDGLYHELVNEPEQREIMEEMLAWMEERNEVIQ